MTVELITGKAGTPHVSSDDIGAMQAGLVGYGNYLLQAKDGTFPKMTLKDNNHVTVPVMNLILEGRYTRVTAADEVTIQSGTSGQKRNDLICLKYTRDSSQVEKVEWVVLKGTNTTGTPADPSVPSGSIIDGSATAYAKIARVSLNGITASAPVMLATNLPPIGDSVTPIRMTKITGDELGASISVTPCSTLSGEDTHLMNIRIRWVNNGEFTSTAWNNVELFKFEGWRTTTEAFGWYFDNAGDAAVASNSAFYANGNTVSWRARGNYLIQAKTWHNGGIIAPVVRA